MHLRSAADSATDKVLTEKEPEVQCETTVSLRD